MDFAVYVVDEIHINLLELSLHCESDVVLR